MLGSRNPRILSLLSILWAALVVAQEADTKPKPASEPEADTATETAAEPATDVRTADLQKIEAAIESYVTAFNGKDVDKLISLWAPDGVYVSQSSGDQLTGHDELKKDFESIFANEDAPKLAVETESIEFISPNVALERGMATVTGKDFVDQTAYRVVYVERDGRWLIDRVTEESVVVKPSNYEHLQGLDFIVGQWVAEIDGTTIEIDCQWTTNQNYLSRKYRVLTDGNLESSGLQDHRLGRQERTNPQLAVRLRGRIRQRHMDTARQRMDRPKRGDAGRRRVGIIDQHLQSTRRRYGRVAKNESCRRRKAVAQHGRSHGLSTVETTYKQSPHHRINS